MGKSIENIVNNFGFNSNDSCSFSFSKCNYLFLNEWIHSSLHIHSFSSMRKIFIVFLLKWKCINQIYIQFTTVFNISTHTHTTKSIFRMKKLFMIRLQIFFISFYRIEEKIFHFDISAVSTFFLFFVNHKFIKIDTKRRKSLYSCT